MSNKQLHPSINEMLGLLDEIEAIRELIRAQVPE